MKKIILIDINANMVKAWQTYALPEAAAFVEICCGSILDLEIQSIVSPANSFGFMDGGIDLLYSQRFGWKVQEKLQAAIRLRHMGELLVGESMVVPTDDDKIPFVVSAPTMRVPMILGDRTVNSYLATKAALARNAPYDGDIAIPGMGTGCGFVPFACAAAQMWQAIKEVRLGPTNFPASDREAIIRQDRLMAGCLT
jgi:O-acetyl-ADP-ribose deacetylase (regulator of RNase III)